MTSIRNLIRRCAVVIAVLSAAGCESAAPSRVPGVSYQVTGLVSIAGIPSYHTGIAGARVEVIAGTGAGISVVTGESGSFSLRGVSGAVALRISREGYQPGEVSLIVDRDVEHALLGLMPAGAVPDVSGTYTLTIRADAECPLAAAGPLPEALRTRRYEATVSQVESRLDVRLAGAAFTTGPDSFWQQSNRVGDGFAGYVTPERVVFVLRGPPAGGDAAFSEDPDVHERVDGLSLIVTGVVSATPARTISGPLSGSLALTGGTAPAFCGSDNHQFVLSR